MSDEDYDITDFLAKIGNLNETIAEDEESEDVNLDEEESFFEYVEDSNKSTKR